MKSPEIHFVFQFSIMLFTKINQGFEKFKKTERAWHILKIELDKNFFQHDLVQGKHKLP